MTLEEQLVRDEDEVLHAYQDSLGYWTIGVGHLIDKRKGGGIPREISRLLLQLDIQEKTSALKEALPWATNLDPVRFAVLANMTFNMGIGDAKKGTGLLGFKNTLALIQAGRYKEAAANMLLSRWATQVGPRATRLARQMETGEWQ